ncbi:glycoside hydrolase family 5 protein [Amanita thiersii Skay4041]|uniref:Glycoside hydrolase family 5 protein n=1 Tax=Amanita thiersii Skay4041 TaxID=703135 RepID=A0A2A9NNA5_9AGAR|nr:glycoside hydrolase family 5 protein [Amanita thiersii Skay4041]
MTHLRISGSRIVDAVGNLVVLRGAGLGGWMLCEYQIREALAEAIGVEKASFFFNKVYGFVFYLEHFFTETDAAFFKSLGLNCIRVAMNYRHFEDDHNPRVLKKDAFKYLDRAVALCAAHSIYTVIDMHSAPGGQSGGWHADGGTHLANFWVHKDFQDRLVWLWTQIAEHYKENAWIAGYNILNEPADPHPEHARLIALYDRVYAAIRAADPDHILFLDGNTFATDFTKFPRDAGIRWRNTAYAIHDYAVYGFPNSPEPYEGTAAQKERLRNTYKRKRKWMDEHGLCVWNGEWGPVYARSEYDGNQTNEINERRYKLLADQLEIYNEDQLSWSIWLYKDIGFQGMVYVSKDTPYMRHFAEFLHKKHRLAVDAWGKDDKAVKSIYDPIVNLIKQSVSDESKLKLYPPIWSTEERVTRLSRTILVAELMVREWAEYFKGMDEAMLENLAKSFRFESCEKREGLNNALRRNAGIE